MDSWLSWWIENLEWCAKASSHKSATITIHRFSNMLKDTSLTVRCRVQKPCNYGATPSPRVSKCWKSVNHCRIYRTFGWIVSLSQSEARVKHVWSDHQQFQSRLLAWQNLHYLKSILCADLWCQKAGSLEDQKPCTSQHRPLDRVKRMTISEIIVQGYQAGQKR